MLNRLRVKHERIGWESAIKIAMQIQKHHIVELEQAVNGESEIDELLNPVRTQEMIIRQQLIKELQGLL